MKTSKHFLFSIAAMAFVINSYARHAESSSSGKGKHGIPSDGSRAGCAAPSAYIDLDYNNVRARIHTGGDMWDDLAAGTPMYEIPKGSGKHSLFAGALWMGGQDVNGQLKLAAQRFRSNGNDYWPGPLSINAAEVDASTCQKYDKHFVITRQEVIEFNSWYQANLDNAVQAAIDFPGYKIPESILNWPAHPEGVSGGANNLAPFYDRNADDAYEPADGDYPLYEINGQDYDCRATRVEKLYGDKTIWWVFNDKGNIHAETGGAPIGMEIHAQGFAFATNDEINNMTFYNYALINRSTYTLENTYFGVWADSDLGFFDDDYVGCDVQRGLGYCYNGKEIDAQDNSPGPGDYGSQPPAVGIDFFEGPYQDNDNMANPLTSDYNVAINERGIPYAGLGIGYGDTIKDNERFGMRRFVYFNKTGQGNQAIQEPSTAAEYYNMMRGIWKDGERMVYGGNGHPSDPNANPAVYADYMFPGTTDPIGFGTGGVSQPSWTEQTSNNKSADRRFVQSAGPFTLLPGAVNDITVGVVWARALSGGPFASVQKLQEVDDKAQNLFDNCFRILDGPDAPDLSIVELDRELVLSLSNKQGSNNYEEKYKRIDSQIPLTRTTTTGTGNFTYDSINGVYNEITTSVVENLDREYKFQGYLIYQVVDNTVSPDELGNPSRARLVAQCDVKDGVGKLVNFKFDEAANASVPEDIIIDGEDKGVLHSFKMSEGKFAQGDKRLVNFKKYHYIALAYAYNNFRKYDPNDPLYYDGQKLPYLLSRKSVAGAILIYSGIPHKSNPSGIQVGSEYGDGPMITRMEGQGNGSMAIDFTAETESEILANGRVNYPVYRKGRGPVNIKVVDPLSVKGDKFQLKIESNNGKFEEGRWTLTNISELNIPDDKTYQPGEYIVNSDTTLKIGNEQIITELGISIAIEQSVNPGSGATNGFIEATMSFSDPSNMWLSGVSDEEGASYLNWIRSGTFKDENSPEYNDYNGDDDNGSYEKLLSGTWAPYRLTSIINHGPAYNSQSLTLAEMNLLKSIDVVITPDKSKWTRCVVVENQYESAFAEGGAKKNYLRKGNSVGKDGKDDGSGIKGLGWFPGYAICLETGDRLNMAFSEDSWLAGENGRDMIWNPSATKYADGFGSDLRMGGKHFIYVFGNERTLTNNFDANRMPAYDEGSYAYSQLSVETTTSLRNVWRSCMWVGFPLLTQGEKLLSSEVRIRLRVNRSYETFKTPSEVNNNEPLYDFSLSELAAIMDDLPTAQSALDLIGVVPNPYYGFSEYEINQLDNRIKIINLPETCVVSIYSSSGTLIRRFNKSDPNTYLDWDLKNQAGIFVSGGVYMIHVNVEGVGEKVIKWFGVLRPVDLSTF